MKKFKLELSQYGDYKQGNLCVLCGYGLGLFFSIPEGTKVIWLVATEKPRKNSYHCQADGLGVDITLSDGNITRTTTYWDFDLFVKECNDAGLFHFQVKI